MYKRGCILTLIGLATHALASEAELDIYDGRGKYPVEYCQGLCDDNKECRHDKHGSYCKTWQDPPVCFGFYHKKPHGYCFEPNDPKCNDAKLDPVKCGHKVGKKGFCQELCEKVDSCRDDPHAHGSYCKKWQDVDVCFGLYHTKHGYCFEPNDPKCNDAKLEPVKCK